MHRAPPSTTVLELTPQASALLDLLVDLGYLDDPALDVVNDRLLDVSSPDGRVDVDIVRRVAAEVLFEHEDRLDAELRRTIDEEWPLLFG